MIRTVSTYSLPDGRVVTADADELQGYLSYLNHSPGQCKADQEQFQNEKQADLLLQKHLAGETITDEQLAFVKEVFPEAFKKRRKAKPKATKPEPKISAARAADLAKRGITNHAPSD